MWSKNTELSNVKCLRLAFRHRYLASARDALAKTPFAKKLSAKELMRSPVPCLRSPQRWFRCH